jgi:hypothetical protein
MKTNFFIAIILAILITSCSSGLSAQEIEATKDASTEMSLQPTMTSTQVALTQELLVTKQPTATKILTRTPTQTPFRCVTLLTPANEAVIPAIGKITFEWEPSQNATFYALDIILPSGTTVSFETTETFRDQYMEAFPPGGTYQWKVIVQDRKKNEICSSEFATFSKGVYYPPPPQTNDDKKRR